jgi:hypothetical protein
MWVDRRVPHGVDDGIYLSTVTATSQVFGDGGGF